MIEEKLIKGAGKDYPVKIVFVLIPLLIILKGFATFIFKFGELIDLNPVYGRLGVVEILMVLISLLKVVATFYIYFSNFLPLWTI